MTKVRIKNIGIVSSRIAGTDGVSLEIEKWVDVLERNNYQCFYFAGELDRDDSVSFKIDLAHFNHPEIASLSKRLFGVTRRSGETSEKIGKISGQLKSALYDFKRKFDIDLLIPENVLAIPMNIPQFQVNDINRPQTGSEGQKEHGIIAFPQRSCTIHRIQQLLFLCWSNGGNNRGFSSPAAGNGIAQASCS